MDDAPVRLRPRLEDDAAGRAARPAFAWPGDAASICLVILTALAVLWALYVAAELVLPIALALVLKLLLQPAMRALTGRLRLPAVAASLGLVLALLVGLGAIGFSVAAPASDWFGKAPQSLSVLEQRLEVVRQPLEVIQRATQRLEALATTRESAPAIAVQESGLGGLLFRGTRTLLGQLVTLCVVLFFLLAAGDTFLRRLVEILPSFADKKRAVEIVYEVEENISLYLVTITLMNLAVGVATGLVTWACGIGDPMLWGVLAFLLNYVAILGPLAGVGMFFLVGLLSFPSLWSAAGLAGAYLAIHIAEGEIITPMLLARRFTLNPVLLIISLFFWYWMWGVPGTLLAVPLLGIVKIVCDRIPQLVPLGHLLGSGPHPGLRSGPLA
jgi:predicted PurR-regulated permease PerM